MTSYTKIDYRCDASMADKRRTLANDRAATLQQHAIAATAQIGGRFGAQRPNVIGAGAAYPAAAPWVGADQAVEPPLGYSVEALVPCGEIHEQMKERSDADLLRGDEEGDDRGQ
jgi:hypothetical protein